LLCGRSSDANVIKIFNITFDVNVIIFTEEIDRRSKMKVVFISDQKKRMAQVYGPELLDRLAKANESEAVIL